MRAEKKSRPEAAGIRTARLEETHKSIISMSPVFRDCKGVS